MLHWTTSGFPSLTEGPDKILFLGEPETAKGSIYVGGKAMKAIQIVAPERVELVDLPRPQAREGEVLVEVRTVSTCPHWDTNLYRGIDIFERPGYPRYPIPAGYPGHEMAGVVAEVGPGARSFKVGDRVAATVSGGETNPGFYCEYINRPEGSLAKVPDNQSFEGASTLELARHVASHVRAAEYAGLRTGIVGLGGGGLIALQMVKALGARETVCMDVEPSRLELAARLGAEETINTGNRNEVGGLEEAPLEASVDCSGVAAGLQTALDHTRGPVVIFGVLHGDASFNLRHWFQRTCIPPRRPPDDGDTEFVLDLWRRGLLDTEVLIGARMPLAEYEKGIEMLMERRAIKVSFHPGQG